jgi:hypothetical protein
MNLEIINLFKVLEVGINKMGFVVFLIKLLLLWNYASWKLESELMRL